MEEEERYGGEVVGGERESLAEEGKNTAGAQYVSSLQRTHSLTQTHTQAPAPPSSHLSPQSSQHKDTHLLLTTTTAGSFASQPCS